MATTQTTQTIEAVEAVQSVERMLPVGADEVVPAWKVSVGMWMLDAETGRWGEVLDAHRGAADWSINAWQVNLSGVGRIWVESDEPVMVRIPATAAISGANSGVNSEATSMLVSA